MITLQQIFNAAWQAFIVENKPPAYNIRNGACCYLTEDGRKCAVGLVLPDGHEAQRYGCAFNGLVNVHPTLFDTNIRRMDMQDLNNFQCELHDGLICDETGEWNKTLEERKEWYRGVAAKYNLTVPE